MSMASYPIKTERLDIIPGPQVEGGGRKYLDDLIAIYGDEDVQEYMLSGERHIVNELYIDDLLDRSAREWASRGCGSLFCIERATDSMVGFVLSVPSHTDGQHHELVYAIHPGFQGRKFAQEAISALLENEFRKTHNKIIATLNPNNRVSRHILTKFGFICGSDHKHGDQIEQVYECTPATFIPYARLLQ